MPLPRPASTATGGTGRARCPPPRRPGAIRRVLRVSPPGVSHPRSVDLGRRLLPRRRRAVPRCARALRGHVPRTGNRRRQDIFQTGQISLIRALREIFVAHQLVQSENPVNIFSDYVIAPCVLWPSDQNSGVQQFLPSRQITRYRGSHGVLESTSQSEQFIILRSPSQFDRLRETRSCLT